MGQAAAKRAKLPRSQVTSLQRHVSFSEDEIQDWYDEFCRRSAKSDTKDLFLSEEEFADVYNSVYPGEGSQFASHIFRTFDLDRNGKISFREFVIGLSISSSEKPDKLLPWAFKVYDVDNSGYIVRWEMTEIIRSVFRMIGQEQLAHNGITKTPEELAQEIFEQMDTNHDDQISWREFCDGAKDNPIVVKLLQCCPPDGGDDTENSPDDVFSSSSSLAVPQPPGS